MQKEIENSVFKGVTLNQDFKNNVDNSYLAEVLKYVFYVKPKKMDYYIEYMRQLFNKVGSGEYHLVVCIAKKGSIVYRAFLRLFKEILGNELNKYLPNQKEIAVIDTRTFCNYFETPENADKQPDSLKRYIQKCVDNGLIKNHKDFKVLVFDDTLNIGRNAFDCINLLKRRGLNFENINYASPAINEEVFDDEIGYDHCCFYCDFKDFKFNNETNEYNTNNVILLDRNKFSKDRDKENAKLVKLFIPEQINDYFSSNFVSTSEIISRAFQLNQFAHSADIPYTSYCAYAKTENLELINKINALLTKNKTELERSLNYEYCYPKSLQIKDCGSVNIKTSILILGFDKKTGSYAGIRIWERCHMDDMKNKKADTMTFFPFVTFPPLKLSELKSEYDSFFSEETIFSEEEIICKPALYSEFWNEEFLNQCKIDISKAETGECTIEEKKTYEKKYFRLKSLVEHTSRRLINTKTSLLLWDFFEKLKDTEIINDKECDDLRNNLAKCVARQFFQFKYITNEKYKKIDKICKFLDSVYKSKNIKENLDNLLNYNCGYKVPFELADRFFFKGHPYDKGESYEARDKVIAEYTNLEFSSHKNGNSDYYLLFNQEIGAFFNKLKDRDLTEHKLPPYPICEIFNKVISKICKCSVENLKNDDIFADCISSLVSLCEDGFSGTVSYLEPYHKKAHNSKEKNEIIDFYVVNCGQHGETSVLVNEFYWSDFQCLNQSLKIALSSIYFEKIRGNKYNDKELEGVICSLGKQFVSEIQKITDKYKDSFRGDKYELFVKEIEKFPDLIISAFHKSSFDKFTLYNSPIVDSRRLFEQSCAYQKQKFGFKFTGDEKDEEVINFLKEIIKIRLP
ncbi:MAG: hypothetical protein LBM93_04970, partial [Oscillospiraceae bacterium]|nr:hypothetical protein [Oscillospiraceae bacterium]